MSRDLLDLIQTLAYWRRERRRLLLEREAGLAGPTTDDQLREANEAVGLLSESVAAEAARPLTRNLGPV